ncbi:hypothetical protein ACEZ3G_05580 [Maribacter algicola]|uniref:Uncharacterized protein n=1 Tax=Meishania litoralis TaxID=3434685 RepID=A0ACC7LIT2_9FLAO
MGCSKNETPTPRPDAQEWPKPDPDPENQESNEPEDEIYFSYYSDPNESDLYNWTDRWIVIHNQDGELLDYRSFKKGDSLDFEGSLENSKHTNTLSITTLNYRPGKEGGNFHSLGTVTGIKKGTVWDWTDDIEPTITDPPNSAQYQIRITIHNIPNVQHFLISSQFDITSIAGSPFYQETNILEIGGARLQKDRDYLISVRDGNDEIKYLWFEVEDPTSNITLDYNDFQDYDYIIEIELPEYEGYNLGVGAKNKSHNYARFLDINREDDGNQVRSTAKLGYLDGYDTFQTYLYFDYDKDVRYSFYKYGGRPTNINVPPYPQFQAENNSIYNYNFTTNVEYYWNTSYWIYTDLEQDNTTRYSISGKSEGAPIIGTLPDQIQEKFPHLNLDNLEYEETALAIGENIDFKSDDRTSLFGFGTVTFSERLIFKNPDK